MAVNLREALNNQLQPEVFLSNHGSFQGHNYNSCKEELEFSQSHGNDLVANGRFSHLLSNLIRPFCRSRTNYFVRKEFAHIDLKLFRIVSCISCFLQYAHICLYTIFYALICFRACSYNFEWLLCDNQYNKDVEP